MIQEKWVPYTARKLYANEWHTLFSQEDGRGRLTWRGRFANVVGPNVYNFYSKEDDVLDDVAYQMTFGETILYHLFTFRWSLASYRRYAWACQELYKGRQYDWQGGTPYGGWGFTDAAAYKTVDGVLFGPDRAAQINPYDLSCLPFFNSDAPITSLLGEPLDPSAPGSVFAANNRNMLLAETIPANSFAAGRHAVQKIADVGGLNIDMNSMKPNGWPRYVKEPPEGHDKYPWIHGDHKAVAYYYTYKVFDEMCNIGEFRQ